MNPNKKMLHRVLDLLPGLPGNPAATALPGGESAFSLDFDNLLGFMAADGDGDDGGGGGDGADGGGGEGGDGGGDGEQKPERPDWLPENLWDAEKGFKADTVSDALAARADLDSRAARVPENAEGYELKLPDNFELPDEFKELVQKGEDGEDIPLIDENDSRLGILREYAHAQGFGQAEFSDILALGIKMDLTQTAAIKDGLKQQFEQLGGRGKERLDAVTRFLGAKLGKEKASALTNMMFTKVQIEAFEDIMRLARGQTSRNPGGQRDGESDEISDEEWEKLSPTQKISLAHKRNQPKKTG